MANQITGRVIAISAVQSVASSDPSKQPFRKREVYIDCTRFDPYTGQRSEFENKPLLTFAGEKTLAKVNPVLDQVCKDDIITISFELVGRQFKDKDQKTRFMTEVRCYDVVITRKVGQQGVQGTQQSVPQPPQQPAPQPQPEPAPQAQSPFVGDNSNDLPF
jgi:hypothetical protein